jgi:uncharacterized protein
VSITERSAAKRAERVPRRPATHDVEILRDVRIPTADPSVTLAADLFLPAGAGPVPLLLTLLPYLKDASAGLETWQANRWFASRGYACLLVDFRGIGGSDGRPRPPFDPEESQDALDAIGWAVQQPWSDGNVGMWGMSYGAVTTMRTAARRPAHLKAIMPVMGMLDPERDFVHPDGFRGGVTSLGMWALGTHLSNLMPPLRPDPTGAAHARWEHRLRTTEPWLMDLFRHGPGHPVWRTRTIDATAIDVPAFCVAGWRDFFCQPMINAFLAIPAPKRLLVGPWMHTPPYLSPFETVDLPALALSWWDRWLRPESEIRDVTDDPVQVFLQGAQPRWVELSAWPPPTRPAGFRAHGTAMHPAMEENESEPGRDAEEWTLSADRTVGTLNTMWAVPITGVLLDQHDDDRRSTMFLSEPLDDETTILGQPVLTLTGALPATLHRVTARLVHIDENGRSHLITSGTLDVRDADSELSAHDRDRTARLFMVSTAYLVPTGGRLGLALAQDDFPRLWPYPHGDQGDHLNTPLTVAIRIELPTGHPNRTVPMPSPAVSQHGFGLYQRPVSELRRDHIADGVRVTVGDDTQTWTPQRERRLTTSRRLTATNSSTDQPPMMTGAATASVDGDGNRIRVSVHTTVTETYATADIHVTLNEGVLFSRRWETAADSFESAQRP